MITPMMLLESLPPSPSHPTNAPERLRAMPPPRLPRNFLGGQHSPGAWPVRQLGSLEREGQLLPLPDPGPRTPAVEASGRSDPHGPHRCLSPPMTGGRGQPQAVACGPGRTGRGPRSRAPDRPPHGSHRCMYHRVRFGSHVSREAHQGEANVRKCDS